MNDYEIVSPNINLIKAKQRLNELNVLYNQELDSVIQSLEDEDNPLFRSIREEYVKHKQHEFNALFKDRLAKKEHFLMNSSGFHPLDDNEFPEGFTNPFQQ